VKTADPASAGDLFGPLAFVHIARLAADEILSASTRELVTGTHTQREPDAVIHEPCGLLCDMERPPDFATADAILAIRNQPCRYQPLV
jgi:hypothetical protein